MEAVLSVPLNNLLSMKKALLFGFLLLCCQWAFGQGKFFGGNDDGYTHVGFSDTLAVSCLPTAATLNVDDCDSYTLNAQTYTSSGTYMQTLQNVAGCDSILTLHLSLGFSSTFTITTSACDSYTLNAQTYSSSGTYTQTLQNAAGCDSVITLHLVIEEASAGALTVETCEPYTLNGQTYTASGTYVQNLTNIAGCDSTLTLALTIDTVDVRVVNYSNMAVALASNASFQWLDCNNGYAPVFGAINDTLIPIVWGSYAVAVTQFGCTDTSACEFIFIDALDPAAQLSFSAFPNPTSGSLQLDWVHPQTHMKVTLIDAQGKQIWAQSVMHSSGGMLPMDVPSGLYLIWLQDENGRRGALKVLKE